MRFRINRASDYEGRQRPCDGAVLGETEPGESPWFIEIGTLEELMALIDREREVIVYPDLITIYDDYME